LDDIKEKKQSNCGTINFGKRPICNNDVKITLGKLFYVPSTKEVFNEFKELIGHGEYKDGILNITHKLALYTLIFCCTHSIISEIQKKNNDGN